MTAAAGHTFAPVALWAAARRCTRCRLVAARFALAGADFEAWMSGGILLGDTLTAGAAMPACPTPYAPNAGTPARSWDRVHAAAGRAARPTAAQARALTTALDGEAMIGRAGAATVGRLRTLAWLGPDYRITPAGAAALERRHACVIRHTPPHH
jgi:hypothetical protein